MGTISRREFFKLGTTLPASLLFTQLPGCNGEQEYTPENLVMDFGPYGRYKTEWNSEVQKYTLGFWESNMVEKRQKDLTDLKIEGGKIAFYMPFDGTINNSAGKITVDQQEWELGNPATHPDENPIVLQGKLVELEYDPGNDSAGFQLWFEN